MFILSALAYLIPFIYPYYTYPCLFIWMLPLLINDYDNKLGFKAGYAWGLVFYSGHLYWLAYILHTQGEHHLRIIAYVCMVLYLSLFSGLWLWGKQLLIYRYINAKNQKGDNLGWCFIWLFSTVIFILITDSCSFALFDCFDKPYLEGYYLANPLLPLVNWPWFMRQIYCFNELFYLVLIVLINISLHCFVRKPDSKSLIFLLSLFCWPFLFQPPKIELSIGHNEIVYLKPLWNSSNLTPAQKFYEISRRLDGVAKNSPNARYIVMPESSFGHDLMEWEHKLDAWTSLFLPETIVFIGAHRKQGDCIYNSLYQIRDGKIIGYYDKQHLVFFTERQPRLFKNWPILSNLFIANEFSFPQHDQADCCLAGFQPAICSEIFCGMRKFKRNSPILFVCHDAWLGYDYARQLARSAVHLYAWRHGVPIIFVGSDNWSVFT